MGRLSHGLEPRLNRTTERLLGEPAIGRRVGALDQSEIGEQELGLAPVLGLHPQSDVAAAEAVDRPVRGEHRVDAGLVQRLVPGPRRAHVAEVAHDLPGVEARVADVDRRLAGAGRAVTAQNSESGRGGS